MEKGLLLDVARKFWPLEDLRAVIRLLDECGLTHLQLHLSDNEAFRLASQAQSEHYSAAELRALETFAGQHGICLVPEFDGPGHLRALLVERPDFALPGSDRTALDVTNPAAVAWLLEQLGEMAELFGQSSIFHIGGDEFIDFRQIEDYPYLLEKTRARFGSEATGLEFYIHYLNQAAEFLQARAKRVRVWNDGLLRHDLSSSVQLNRELEICYWTRWDEQMASAKDWIRAGYSLINFDDNDLYYVLGKEEIYPYPSPEKLSVKFDRNKFSAQQFLSEEEMGAVKGTYFSVWGDVPEAQSLAEILSNLTEILPVFSAKLQKK